MNSDAIFSEPRWKILQILTTSPSSPLEIAKKVNTSVAYVSQQLKLLEAANIIKKERTGSAEKGKPRSLYSISEELLHLTALIRGNPAKKLIYLSEHHKLILKIWLLESSQLHYFIEKLYWRIEEDLDNIKNISFDSLKKKLLIVSESKLVKTKVASFSKEINGLLDISVVEDLKNLGDLCIIYESSLKKELKGGKNL